MIYSQPRSLVLPVLAISIALLTGGLIYSGAPVVGILLLVLPIAAFAALCGWRAAIKERE